MGGRGSSSSGGGSKSLRDGGSSNVNIVSEEDVWSYRHNPNNAQFVDDINGSVRDVQRDFGDVMNTVNTVSAAQLDGRASYTTLGYYSQEGGLALNKRFTEPSKMNKVYDEAIEQGYHPKRGNKSGTEAVTYHEMGHALADNLKTKLGEKDVRSASRTIVKNAYKTSGEKGGTYNFASKISGYATKNYAECVAEAVTDWYCNGNNASKASKAIVSEMKRINAL